MVSSINAVRVQMGGVLIAGGYSHYRSAVRLHNKTVVVCFFLAVYKQKKREKGSADAIETYDTRNVLLQKTKTVAERESERETKRERNKGINQNSQSR